MSDLLTIDEIAATLGLRRETVRDKVVKRADFPRPAIALSQKTRRWSVADVQGWLTKHHEMNSR
jgi:predicted DNA-binding transcriptional regulator AlpA